MLKVAIVAAGILAAGSAFADEVVIHRDGPPPPPDRSVTIEHHEGAGCETKTVHKENDMGDSKTVTKSNC